MAVIDEVVTFHVQETKVLALEHDSQPSFYSLLVNILEQIERLDPQGQVFRMVWDYFMRCKKTYMIEVETMKGKDEGRKASRKLITRDVSFLIEGCVSANPNIS